MWRDSSPASLVGVWLCPELEKVVNPLRSAASPV